MQSALIVGFGDNERLIRGLMRFIKMTSREFIFEDATQNRGAPIINVDGFKLKRGLRFFYILNLSIGKVVL